MPEEYCDIGHDRPGAELWFYRPRFGKFIWRAAVCQSYWRGGASHTELVPAEYRDAGGVRVQGRIDHDAKAISLAAYRPGSRWEPHPVTDRAAEKVQSLLAAEFPDYRIQRFY